MSNQTNPLIVQGEYAKAKVFAPKADEGVLNQIEAMTDHPMAEDTHIRIMPDCHVGKGSTIGTTIQLPKDQADWRVCPNVVGVDIGCGMYSVQIDSLNPNTMPQLDRAIKQQIPTGFKVHKSQRQVRYPQEIKEALDRLTIPMNKDLYDRLVRSLGTLGGGNHFIELSRSNDGSYWLTIHSGSRNLGVQVAEYHQQIAHQMTNTRRSDLDYLTDDPLDNYLNDVTVAQTFAHLNRKAMIETILEQMGWQAVDQFDSIHNFVDPKEGIIRKGATSAHEGERLLIPLNMKDGSLIARGLGNKDWNYSAPHGAGRLMSRTQARKQLKINEFQQMMKGIYSTSVNRRTIDEAPLAYKPKEWILDEIDPTVEVLHHLTPIYNFKG
ncbi:RtcB family protein [Dolosicoccus paucivorans]|uniref:3'-phosphate/5'-hydroxy nucleic acid ligase n=1 Tax=Dolosicoccus paucivorans TaxID=84521 RepID=A0A2N6SPR5_9LACT|nr:RtcB family protein [Dolosicoccus paucivorans]PMB84422.1 RNA-splicing ligase RtcB [Dolosicoccus paucivorans]PMC59049.1 RNA-splicing ligase RtcB [Dolosicoccus paucivorans]